MSWQAPGDASPRSAATRGTRVRRAIAPSVLLSTVTVALVLGLAVSLEGLLRLWDRGRADDTGLDSMHAYSETYGWTLRRGVRRTAQKKTISINDHGYRGNSYDFARTPGTLRMVMLGDSIAFGPGVDDAETFSQRLDSLQAGWEVINLAVMGYGTDQELLKLEREGLAYGPDVVVLHFCLHNDFADNMLSRSLYDGVHPKPYFTVEADELRRHDAHLKRTLGQRAASFLRSTSQLYRLATAAAQGLATPAAGSDRDQSPHWLDRMEQALQDLGRATDVTFRIIEAMHRLAARRGACQYAGQVAPSHPVLEGDTRTPRGDRARHTRGGGECSRHSRTLFQRASVLKQF